MNEVSTIVETLRHDTPAMICNAAHLRRVVSASETPQPPTTMLSSF
jgi:hypothetical protein